MKDVYNIGENPQFRLEVKAQGSAAVWCLLSRHITDIEDFKDNKEYIALLVYDTDGKRVYYPRKINTFSFPIINYTCLHANLNMI